MEKEFVPYELALELKELGFDEPCFGIWVKGEQKYKVMYVAKQEDAWMAEQNDGILAPLYQQAFKWFRVEHGLYSAIVPKKSWPDNFVSGIEWYLEICGGDGKELSDDGVRDFNESQISCLKQLIDIIKK